MLKFNHNKVFFTSDTHFSHKNIIRYCDRPFASVEEMNKGIITMWNETVPKDGIVFHMGDVCFGGNARWEEMLSQLNGTIYLIRGNHDMEHPPQHLFGGVYDQLMIQVEGDEEIPYLARATQRLLAIIWTYSFQEWCVSMEWKITSRSI